MDWFNLFTLKMKCLLVSFWEGKISYFQSKSKQLLPRANPFQIQQVSSNYSYAAGLTNSNFRRDVKKKKNFSPSSYRNPTVYLTQDSMISSNSNQRDFKRKFWASSVIISVKKKIKTFLPLSPKITRTNYLITHFAWVAFQIPFTTP